MAKLRAVISFSVFFASLLPLRLCVTPFVSLLFFFQGLILLFSMALRTHVREEYYVTD